jgi:hypothetical protein
MQTELNCDKCQKHMGWKDIGELDSCPDQPLIYCDECSEKISILPEES